MSDAPLTSDDLLNRLVAVSKPDGDWPFEIDGSMPIAAEAAAEIERLRGALGTIASWREGTEVSTSFDEPASARVARVALGKSAAKENDK